MPYVSVNLKFVIAFLAALLWAATSFFLARYWLGDLATHIGAVLAWVVIFGIAIIPGYMK